MKILHTEQLNPALLSPKEQLALYSGMDVLCLPEIYSQLYPLLSPAKRTTYEFEMELQAPLLEMSFQGIPVDTNKRDQLIREHEAELVIVNSHLHKLCEAIGYYDYYIARAVTVFSSYVQLDFYPKSWNDWLFLPIQLRREIKKAAPDALVEYHKALREFSKPFNGNSPTQKLRLFYDFFGRPDNVNANQIFLPAWNKAHGIAEHKTRNIHGEYTPAVDREALEKIETRAKDNNPADAHFWAYPFVKCCLEIADLTKTLGFLRCKLEKGYFRASFGAVTETGRLASRENAQGYGSNAQNITPRLRIILTSPTGYKSSTPDYEQIESRNVGAICYVLFGSTAYLNATECGDLHTLVCSMVWDDMGWPADFTLDQLEKHGPFPKDLVKAAKTIANQNFYRIWSYRDAVKRLGHGSNYRGKPPHMAKMTHIPVKLVDHFQSVYFERFPEIPQYHRWVAEQLQTKGEITTIIFNRCRKFFGRPNDDSTIRVAIAYSPQSMAADYTNHALLDLLKSNLPMQIFLQKHDEVGVRYKESDEQLVVPAVCKIMEKHYTLTAPDGRTRDWFVPAEPQVGWNLGYRKDKDEDGNPLPAPINPDGLIKYSGRDDRTRQENPFDFMMRRL